VKNLLLALTFGLFLAPIPAYSHSGGLDANGCHHDYVHGGYHCHRSPSYTPPVVQDDKAPVIIPQTPPQSYVGPRGGVYHYSANGKKVYEKR
jgi:hypothetical protein